MAEQKFTWTKERLEYLLQLIGQTYVEKVTGKGLSTNDFTADLLAKLNGIGTGAQANTIEKIKLAGTELTPDANKAVDIPRMGGANASNNGTIGLTPAPAKGDQGKYLRGDGSWAVPDNTTYDPATQSAQGLMSANDKKKLDGIATGATANTGTITGITMNGTSKGTSGVVDLGTVITSHQSLANYAPKASPALTGTPTAPTATTGTNNTQIANTAFVAAAITAALNNITGVQFSFVASLPATGAAGTFYFLPAEDGSGTNNYIEYVWNGSANKFEEVGRPTVDLSGYMRSADYPVITEAEITAMFQ